MKTAKQKHEVPTIDTMIKGEWVEDHLDAKAGGAKRLRRLDSDALDKALMDKLITMDEHCTLESFRGQLYAAGLVFCPRAGMDVAGTSGQGQFLADAKFAQARRVSSQMKALSDVLSRTDLSFLLEVLTMDLKVTKPTAPILSTGASALDRLYGRGA